MGVDYDSRAAAIETLQTPPEASQLLSPLDFLFAEHFRQRILCAMLDKIAEDGIGDDAEAAAMVGFLASDFGAHVLDEEEDLFPVLRRRAGPADRIGELLDELSQEHASDLIDAKAIIREFTRLRNATARRRPGPDFRQLLTRFAANERRHLITENAIVMPLARALLKAGDLEHLGRGMAARRGWAYPKENGDG